CHSARPDQPDRGGPGLAVLAGGDGLRHLRQHRHRLHGDGAFHQHRPHPHAAPAFTLSPHPHGQSAVHGVVLKALSSQTETETDTANAAMSRCVNPTVNPERYGFPFQVTASTATTTAGAPFDVTVTALDANNNVATGYTGTVHFTTTDNSHMAQLPADYTFD